MEGVVLGVKTGPDPIIISEVVIAYARRQASERVGARPS
jgi:hypothetical protein